MIKYSAHPNQYNSVQCAISAVLPVFHEEGWKAVAAGMSKLLEDIWSTIPYGDADTCKKLRKAMLADATNIIKGRKIRTTIMSKWNSILEENGVTGVPKLQLVYSLIDAPKFPLYKEADLHKMADNIVEHKSEINAITYFDKEGNRICPYSPEDYHNDDDLIGTIRSQHKNIKEFLLTNSSEPAEKEFYLRNADSLIEQVIEQLQKVAEDYSNYLNGSYCPTGLESGFFSSIAYIRNKIEPCQKAMIDYASGNALKEQFSLSESKSPISNNDYVMRAIHALGWNKSSCPAVLSNIFYANGLKKIGIVKQQGQIEIDEEVYFQPAPGLGPGYKVRWVYSVDTNVNNYLTPLADLIQKADKV